MRRRLASASRAKPERASSADSGSDPFSACASPQGYNLSQGAYTFEVRAIDAAGNAGASSQFTWTIDATAPATPVMVNHPANPMAIRARRSRSPTPSR